MPILINIDGADGAGKSTVSEQLGKTIRALRPDTPVYVDHLPWYKNKAGKVFLEEFRGERTINDITLLQMVIGDYSEWVDKVYNKYPDDSIVILDRYVGSFVAYQGAFMGHPLEVMMPMVRYATQNLQPDLTIILDISAEESVRRINARNNSGVDMFDQGGLDKKRLLTESYRSQYNEAVEQGEPWFMVSAEQHPFVVFNEVADLIFGCGVLDA